MASGIKCIALEVGCSYIREYKGNTECLRAVECVFMVEAQLADSENRR